MCEEKCHQIKHFQRLEKRSIYYRVRHKTEHLRKKDNWTSKGYIFYCEKPI